MGKHFAHSRSCFGWVGVEIVRVPEAAAPTTTTTAMGPVSETVCKERQRLALLFRDPHRVWGRRWSRRSRYMLYCALPFQRAALCWQRTEGLILSGEVKFFKDGDLLSKF